MESEHRSLQVAHHQAVDSRLCQTLWLERSRVEIVTAVNQNVEALAKALGACWGC